MRRNIIETNKSKQEVEQMWESLTEEQRNAVMQLANEIKEFYESDANAYPKHRPLVDLISSSNKITPEIFGNLVGEAKTLIGIQINTLYEIEADEYRPGLNVEM